MKVAAYQAPLLPSGSMEAVGLIEEQVRRCESAGVAILCCPEAVLGGLADYSGQPCDLGIDISSGRLQAVLTSIASETVTTIVGFTEWGANGRLFNAAAVFSKGAVVGLYRKLHPAINRSIYEPGTDTPIFTVGDLTFGILICRDSTYREPARSMADRGATVLFVPTNNGLPPAKGGVEVVEQARDTDIASAREHGVAIVRADVTGRANGLVSYGSSGIVDRNGVVLQVGTQFRTGLLVADLETERNRLCEAKRIGLTSKWSRRRAPASR